MTDDEITPVYVDHRCERCNAGAYVQISKRVDGETLTLWFCKHHYEANALALTASGWVLTQDRRAELLVKP